MAKLLEHTWLGILDSTTGVVFMGTPHRGTGAITSKGLVYAAIASNPFLQVDNTVLRALEAGNDVLMDVFGEFMFICNSRKAGMSLCCFFEQRSSAVGKVIGNSHLEVSIGVLHRCQAVTDLKQEFVVDKVSGCIEGYPKHGLPLDHFRLNKFSDPEDGNYRAVRDEIQRLVEEAPEKLRIRHQGGS